jgi:hypothetical protein
LQKTKLVQEALRRILEAVFEPHTDQKMLEDKAEREKQRKEEKIWGERWILITAMNTRS